MLPPLSPELKRDLLLSVGSHRDDRPLSPEEVGRAFQKAVDDGASLRELAVLVHFDGTSMITRFTRLLRLPADVLRIVGWGQTSKTISFTSASEISRLKTKDDQTQLALGALAKDLTSSEIKAIVQLKLRSADDIRACMESIARLRQTTVTRHVIMGSIIDEDLKAVLRERSQNLRDQLLTLALKTLLGNSGHIEGKLSAERFTLVTEDAAVAKDVTQLHDGMEESISQQLSRELAKETQLGK